jgi:hypothetical protein
MSKPKNTKSQNKQKSKDELEATDDSPKPLAERAEDKKPLSMKEILEARDRQHYQQQQE